MRKEAGLGVEGSVRRKPFDNVLSGPATFLSAEVMLLGSIYRRGPRKKPGVAQEETRPCRCLDQLPRFLGH